MFFNKLSDLFNDIDTEFANSLIVGGDFNIIFDQDLDGHGGHKKNGRNQLKCVEDIMIENDLVDIWRVRHPHESRFTWRQKITTNSTTPRFLAH